MKRVLKVLTGILVSAGIVGSAVASEGYYGLPKTKASNANGQYPYVVVNNYTYDTYTVFATFQPTGKYITLPLDIYGTSRSSITYNINYPDNSVCLSIYRDFDHALTFNGCLPNGPYNTVNIGPYAANSKTPVAKVTQQSY